MTGPVADEVVLVVDAANVVGSRPDGWWRDRAGAATRLLGQLARLVGAPVVGPDGGRLRVVLVDVVLEGGARGASAPDVPGLVVHLAPHDGDTEVVERASAAGSRALVVTADRGLRARLGGARVAGPGWLLTLLEAAAGPDDEADGRTGPQARRSS
ncbi:hypothetical protein J1G42_11510 [Cellulomonas sp. zg-ZUI222]|uniref:NTP pyrophosphohydrolase n=1 Tax=Cellulomonas wangleii TaxID=2816956 RepID=A0ABX8D861_9CELL|nr:hypothetical protein [Cellulomonas wangleii]MBO0921454.1 hypothetical protein [Cellulomonas wangleii]MBO0925871.1 hypothetical protein [Cellulomonas wangleii]QVI63620.1 hypothetical protein KG103_07165 [Cellulomonas wangleii]